MIALNFHQRLLMSTVSRTWIHQILHHLLSSHIIAERYWNRISQAWIKHKQLISLLLLQHMVTLWIQSMWRLSWRDIKMVTTMQFKRLSKSLIISKSMHYINTLTGLLESLSLSRILEVITRRIHLLD